MTTNPDLTKLIETLPPHRQNQASELLKHTWFRDTAFDIQKELLTLPEDYNGFVQDLTERHDEIGEVDVLRLLQLGHGNFLITPIFEVRSNITNQIHTFEYTSWKTGSHPGARFVIFLETDSKITHFLVSKTHRFSTDSEEFGALGGLYVHMQENKPQNLPKKIEQEICFHLGIDELVFKKVINLGTAHPDEGMTNNVSDLYAATLDISQTPNLTTKSDFRVTHKPVGFELQIVHINELKKYLNLVNDNYFLSIIARCLVSNELSLEI